MVEPVYTGIVDIDRPGIVGVDHLVGIVLAEGDAPALAAEFGQLLVIEFDPAHRDVVVVLILFEGEVLAAALVGKAPKARGSERLQAHGIQPLDHLHFEQRVAWQDQQAVVLDVVQLGAAILPADLCS